MHNEWIMAALGGALIGVSASLMLFLNGRVAGMSGILNGTLAPIKAQNMWRWFYFGRNNFGGCVPKDRCPAMKLNFSALFSGVIFSLGLGLSGMTQPTKVIGFLDLFGRWDPTLIFVMGGAIVVHMTASHFILHRRKPLWSTRWFLPEQTNLTPALIFGALIFGAGWGLGGYCPGPAVTALASLRGRPFSFVASMIVGMPAFDLLNRKFKFKK